MGVIGFGAWGAFWGVLGRSNFLWDVDGFGLATIALPCPAPNGLLTCFEAIFAAFGIGFRLAISTGGGFWGGGRTGESFTLFLLSPSSVAVDGPFFVVVPFTFLAGFLRIGLGVGGASSSSLVGTSKIFVLTGDADEGALDVYLFGILSGFSDSRGEMLGDLDSENALSPISDASAFGTGDTKL